MIINIDLTDSELYALNAECGEKETIEQVIHRLVIPLVARVTKTRFDTFLTKFQTETTERQAQIIATLEKITS